MSFIDRSPNWLIMFNIKSISIYKFIKSLISTQILISSLKKKKIKSNLSNKKS